MDKLGIDIDSTDIKKVDKLSISKVDIKKVNKF